MGKTAVVIVHGMGSQVPQETAQTFAENYKEDNDLLYSQPDRVTGSFETRRLHLRGHSTDFFEFYWADLMKVPARSQLYRWMFKLFFKKTKNKRIIRIKIWILIGLMMLALIFFAIYQVYQHSVSPLIQPAINSVIQPYLDTALGIALGSGGIYAIKLFLGWLNWGMLNSFGDVLNYLVPTPTSTQSRHTIRQKGIELLDGLHKKRKVNGEKEYDEVVIVSHSLGTVVAYDLITHLWTKYMYDYDPKTQKVNQSELFRQAEFIVTEYGKNNKSIDSFDKVEYRKMQEKLLKEVQSLNNPWLISNFITMGSPLGYASFLMSKNDKDFLKKKRYNQFPMCPPRISNTTTNNGKVIKDKEFPFFYETKFEIEEDAELLPVSIRTINHSGVFSMVKWTNIFFSSDLIGSNIFSLGKGIKNYEFKSKGNWFSRNTIKAHTQYWYKNQVKCMTVLRKIIKRR